MIIVSDLDSIFAEAVARSNLRLVTLIPIGAPDRRMWQCAGYVRGHESHVRVEIEPTPDTALRAVLGAIIRLGPIPERYAARAVSPSAPDDLLGDEPSAAIDKDDLLG